MSATHIRNLTLPDGSRGDIAICNGRIDADAPVVAEQIDGTGYVAIPRLTDAHIHLDKTLLGDRWYPHRSGKTVAERIDHEIELLGSPEVEPTFVRACRLVELAVRNGSTRLRSHVDISTRLGLDRLLALEAVRKRYQGIAEITFVAFPQEGILRSPGTAELLDEALARGVEAVGGLDPQGRDGDMERHLDIVFELAVQHARRVDIHLHDPGEIGTATMREIALRTRALGLCGMVAISHGYALSEVNPNELRRTATALADAGVTLVT